MPERKSNMPCKAQYTKLSDESSIALYSSEAILDEDSKNTLSKRGALT